MRGHLLGGPRQGRDYEHRFPAALGILVGVALYAALPSDLTLGSRFLVPGLELVLLVPVLVINPRRLTRQTPMSRVLSLALVGVIGIANLVSLVLLVRALVQGGANDSHKLLLAALQIWLTNIIVFGLAYWELDRGGPVQRAKLSRAELPAADFRFSQDEDDDAIDEVAASSSARVDWAPVFVDYLYLSVTNSSAFSPTDTMPLSSRAKLLMSVQAISALIVSLLVIAKAVGGLK
jgi:uncharacterized membrane protein